MPFQALAKGRPMAAPTSRNGPNTVDAAPLAPSTAPDPRKSSVRTVTEVSTRSTSVNRDREWRDDRRESAICRRAPRSELAGGRLRQHVLQDVEFLQRLATADGDAVQRVLGDVDRHAGLVLEESVEAVQQRTATGEHDAL